MQHNHTHKGMFMSSLARRLGLFALVAALGCALLFSAAAQNNRAQKAQPRATPTPQIERKTTTNSKPELEQFLPVTILSQGLDQIYPIASGVSPTNPHSVTHSSTRTRAARSCDLQSVSMNRLKA